MTVIDIQQHPKENTPLDVGALDQSVALAFRLLGDVDTFALQLARLGEIDLPPVVGSPADQANLLAVAPLYLASELESVGLIPTVEMLAGLFRRGGLTADLGPAARLLSSFWQTRRERFSAQERQALFARLFGNRLGPSLAADEGSNDTFETLLVQLAEALHELHVQPVFGRSSSPHRMARIQYAGRQLSANLASRSGGIMPFAARDIMASIRQSIDILKQPAVQRAVGARSVWSAVRRANERYLRRTVDLGTHVQRGRSGLLILSWLGNNLPKLSGAGDLSLPADPTVISAATQWLQASLSLAEKQNTAQPHVR